MEEFSADVFWLFFAYFVGSVVTYFLLVKTVAVNAISATIDQLAEAGFLRTRKTADGDYELLKWNHSENDQSSQ